MAQHPATVTDCLPQLRMFARVMCNDVERADDLVARCLSQAQDHLSEISDAQSLLPALLNDLARLIREQEVVRAPPASLTDRDPVSLIRQLPPYHRNVLMTVTVFGLRYWEAAAICDCPIGTIKSRLNRAKAAFAINASEASRPERARIHTSSHAAPVQRV
ncbi:sigma factor-like helix-turn-helix DNA-binding protein [Allorhizobium sp. NPDC080224]|uniref:sigma factor-like helix-turn-helix DNA-binding protein n=1 Tax=Allorhizobium sp. NPDC080224 TaxID=3390547 RepID=UPI003D016F4F